MQNINKSYQTIFKKIATMVAKYPNLTFLLTFRTLQNDL